MPNRLREIRKKHGDTQRQLAAYLNVTPQMVSKYELGISEMSGVVEKRISQRYGVTIDYLRGNVVKATATRIPVYTSIPAGIPLDSIRDIDGWEEIPADMPGTYFGLKVKGRSMEPVIRDGDTVICVSQDTVDSGDIAVIVVRDNEATLKQYKRSCDGITLIGFNPDVYPPHFYTAYEVDSLPIRVVGKAVEVRHKL